MKLISLFYTFSLTAALAGGAVCLTNCGGGTTKKPPVNTEDKLVLKACPAFNPDSAYQFIKAQVDFGTRVPNTEPHRRCKDYLFEQLKKYGFAPIIQNFEATAYNGKKLTSFNIIGTFNPQAAKRILLAAHWDTRPYNDKEAKDSTQFKPIDGANDGGSGVGVLLEIARTIATAKDKPQIGVDIIFFDSEDYGQPENSKDWKPDFWCLGSQYWAKNKHKENYSAYYGILLDMVGAKGAKFHKEGTSLQYAREITNHIWRIANELNYGLYFKMAESPSITDDHTYVNTVAKIPMTDIVEYDPTGGDSFFGKYHHTSADNMTLIDTNTLKAVGQTVLQVLYNEAVEM
jgi:hypothetical protein